MHVFKLHREEASTSCSIAVHFWQVFTNQERGKIVETSKDVTVQGKNRQSWMDK